MIVVDASAIIDVIAYRPDEQLLHRLAGHAVLHAPHLLDVEVWSSLRSGVHRGVLTDRQADDAHESYRALTIDRYPHVPLAERVWQLRHNLTMYDATYVALAEALDATLVTTDARLAAAPDLPVEIACYQPS